ncbi:MAG: mannose-1-phosphate guanylyltransferase [Flavobacteriaceae bacterium]|nr:mannose-1-phosphate guanylyltransferase [Flavobacteriaceae bacterium]
MSKIINVILSGGSGTRLWPLSRKTNPKQFLQIFDNKSLFQHTVIRNKDFVDSFMLITNGSQYRTAEKQIKELKSDFSSKIIEPVGRNTAPAIALACFDALKDDSILFVTPSDHMIEDMEIYGQSISKAVKLAESGSLVTFGMRPTYPETGFGYIESNGEEVLSFREKPDLKTAKQFLNQGNFLWNSGMFCFKASVFLEELKKYRGDIYHASKKAYDSMESGKVDLDLMKAIPEESIDYAVFEHSDKIKTVNSTFYWTDLGSFDSLINYQTTRGNIDGVKEIEGVGNDNSYHFGKKPVYGYGIKNTVLVETEDCILMLPLNSAKGIKEVYNMVKLENKKLIE